MISSADGWYLQLIKPAWAPPHWLFGPVWVVHYAVMAVAAWLVWRDGGWKKHPHALWLFVLQFLLGVLWNPLFFGLHRLGLAFVDSLLLWLFLAITRRVFAQVSAPAAALLMPSLVWVSFIVMLNFALWRFNR